MTRLLIIVLVFAAGAAAPLASVAAARDEPMMIRWDDLLPEGEEERLGALYDEFYAGLEERIKKMSVMPLNEAGRADLTAEGGALDEMPQIGTFNTVDDLDGVRVRIPGYIVPLDATAVSEFTEFLLVPYFGACIHTPPPPPNQIIYVKASPALKADSIWDPFWINGVLTTGKIENDMGDAAYRIELDGYELFRG